MKVGGLAVAALALAASLTTGCGSPSKDLRSLCVFASAPSATVSDLQHIRDGVRKTVDRARDGDSKFIGSSQKTV